MSFNPRGLQTESRRDWLEHDYTVRMRRDAQTDIARALAKLVNVCRETSDPKVARALGEYEHFVKLEEFLGLHKEAAE